MRTRGWMALGLLVAMVLSGCGAGQTAQEGNPQIELGTPFQLGAGNTATLSPDNISVTFIGVSEDSRCPSGVQCAWAGQAVVQIKVTHTGGGPATADLTLGGAKAGSTVASFGLYKMEISALDPLPITEVATKPGDYVATLVLTKK